jgi:hypothetical protein
MQPTVFGRFHKTKGPLPIGRGIPQALLFHRHKVFADTPPQYDNAALPAPALELQLRLDACPALPCRRPILP